ncbi:ribonuclease-3 [Oribacterium sp. KHPX15]|uniref:ribonuclease III n=1 Tax=unclassified Oribacterium TaxID=2629782 RepID=UPI0004E1446A|nr:MULTISPECIES: ribonuclease III [unclassified Oribacterium]SDZ89606.1 ribonuclease-3 [Oribacterium sp. KHPX15]
MSDDLEKLQEALGYHFNDVGLLKHALTHPSFSNENGEPKEASNQRLEFLGDAVLELISSVFLFNRKPVLQEGVMTKVRASLVCEPTLAEAARKVNLGDYIILGKGEARERINNRDSVISDAFEAVIGAMYLDGGFEQAQNFVNKLVLTDIESAGLFRDAKTVLQEYVSQNKMELEYRVIEESGPCHDRFYRVQAILNNREYGIGEGSSKKKGEQGAAYQTLKQIKAETGYVFKIY